MIDDANDAEGFRRRALDLTLRSHAEQTAFRNNPALAQHLDLLASAIAAAYDCVLQPHLVTFDPQEARFLYEELLRYREHSPTVEGLLDRMKDAYSLLTGESLVPNDLPEDL